MQRSKWGTPMMRRLRVRKRRVALIEMAAFLTAAITTLYFAHRVKQTITSNGVVDLSTTAATIVLAVAMGSAVLGVWSDSRRSALGDELYELVEQQ